MAVERPLQRELDLAAEVAWQAGKIAMRYFQAGVQPEFKDDASPVTVADREAEAAIRQRLGAAFPDDGIVGEEYGEERGRSGRRWIIDPIDGTKSFVQGVPLFGVLIGLEDENDVVAGAVYMPGLDELVCAARHLGCWWNGRRAGVSRVDLLSEACLCYTSAASFSAQRRQGAFDRAIAAVRLARGWGDCYGHILVATGRADLMLDPVMNPWDCAPLLPILREAGGTFTDWRGRATIHGGDAVSTNGLLFQACIACLDEDTGGGAC